MGTSALSSCVYPLHVFLLFLKIDLCICTLHSIRFCHLVFMHANHEMLLCFWYFFSQFKFFSICYWVIAICTFRRKCHLHRQFSRCDFNNKSKSLKKKLHYLAVLLLLPLELVYFFGFLLIFLLATYAFVVIAHFFMFFSSAW